MKSPKMASSVAFITFIYVLTTYFGYAYGGEYFDLSSFSII